MLALVEATRRNMVSVLRDSRRRVFLSEFAVVMR
jgi:hypothetical protein